MVISSVPIAMVSFASATIYSQVNMPTPLILRVSSTSLYRGAGSRSK